LTREPDSCPRILAAPFAVHFANGAQQGKTTSGRRGSCGIRLKLNALIGLTAHGALAQRAGIPIVAKSQQTNQQKKHFEPSDPARRVGGKVPLPCLHFFPSAVL
jgi:hypothetical protein